MKKNTLIALAFFMFSLNAVTYSFNDPDKFVSRGNDILPDNKSGSMRYFKPKKNEKILVSQHLNWLYEELGVAALDRFILQEKNTDQLGFVHYRYKQAYNNTPVDDGVFYVHAKNGFVVSANGEYHSNVQLKSQSISISSGEAIGIAKKTVRSNRGAWNDKITSHPEKVIVIDNSGNYKLTYKVDVYSLEPLERKFVYVDAFSGNVLKERNRIYNSDVIGSATTKYSGVQTITTDSIGVNSYVLRDNGRNVYTRDLNNAFFTGGAVDFTDTDNVWNNVNAQQDEAATDAHWAAEQFYDYFLNTFGLNSYDNSGAALNTYVHYGVNFDNAFWDGTSVSCGDGNGANHTAYVALDVISHEFSHGIIENTANLLSSFESGSLAESYGDIFGTAIEFFAKPGSANYTYAEDVSTTGTPIRSLSNPNQYGHPDTYLGTNWATGPADNGGVHTNNGVQNYWFYLLANGGSGVNDIGNSFSVTGIGMEKAVRIAYRTLTVYLTSNSQYADARTFSIQAAVDLYGACSAEAVATQNAWHAVGIGIQATNSPVVASFSSDVQFSCSVPTTVNFIDLSQNATISHKWYFGDGDSSSVSNPSHTYTSAGIFTVTLIVEGIGSCGTQIDTLTQLNYVTVTSGGGPVSINCSPGTTGPGTFGMGIFNVNLNTINHTTAAGGIDGYQDYSCAQSTNLTEGNTYNINVTTGSGFSENVRAWIDFNNDGIFASVAERVFESNNVFQNHSGTIMIPTGTVLNTPLRLRVSSDFEFNTVDVCTSLQYGQHEDYTVVIIPNTNPPIVDFVADDIVVNIGQTVNFTDLSQNVPTGWSWDFIGATPTSSSLQNPSVTYSALGTYAVKLRATNAFGADSLTKTAYINVVNQFNLCGGLDSTSATSGQLFDSGGPFGNYSNNENCSFLINPGCALDITLSFSNFNSPTSSDFMRVYDGTDATGTLIGVYGFMTTPPPAITASSGSMFITWFSNGFTNYSGFEASWTSTVPTSAPTASFSMSNSNPPLNTVVDFTDLSTNFVGAWSWDFGDANSAFIQHPTHTYASPGTYTVQLISDNCFATDTITQNITVQGAPVINVTPSPVIASVACGDSINVEVNFFNTGAGDLVYEVENSGSVSGTIELLALTYGVDLVTEYPNTISAINQSFTNYNLTTVNTTSAVNLQAALVGKDVFLVPEQENGLESVFTGFASVLQNFVSNGGSVIFCGSVGNFIFNTGLFSGNYLGFSGSVLTLVNNVHPLSNSITAPVVGPSATFSYNITNTDAFNIVESNGNAVVSYREVGAGKVILVGFDYYNTNNNVSRFIANAVEWAGTSSFADWLSIDMLADTVNVSDTSIINFTFNAEDLFSGTYYDTITVNSNDLTNSPLSVPVEFTVTGQPLISVSPNNFNFGTLQVGASISDTLIIDNGGCDTLDVTSFVATNVSFTSGSGSLQIPPFSSDTVIISFSPDTIRTYADTLFINNNDTNTFVLLNGVGVGSPIITYNPTSITDTIFSCNDSITIPITVYNTGQGALNSSINLAEVSLGSGNFFYDGFENGNLNSWTLEPGFYTKQVTTSNPASGSYALEFLNGSAGHLDGVSSTFANSTPSEISFKIKNSTTTQYGSFVVIGDNPGAFNDNMIHIQMRNSGNFWVNGLTTSSYIANQWVDVELMNIDWVAKSFDLYIDGNLIISSLSFFDTNISQLNQIHLYTWSGGNCAFDDIQIGSNVIPQWVTSSLDTINVSVNDSSMFNVTLNSAGLNSGTYNTDVILSSNDPLSPIDTIPVSFTVVGSPELALSDTCLDFGSIMENTTAYDSLTIFNNGCDTLFVTNITSGIGEYTSDTTNLLVLPGDSGSIYVTFSPTSTGTFNSMLNIFNNDIDTTICLNGVATPAPIISYNPTSITDTIFACNDSITVPITVYNTGQGDLIIGASSTGGNGSLPLDSVLFRLNNGFTSITSLIPNIYNFSEGIFGNSIIDGGGDMYDGGNRLNTNLGFNIPYSDNIITTSVATGSSGSYFTRKNTGLFVFAADLDNVSTFSITGDRGADGSGNIDGTVLTSTVNGKTYNGYVTRVYNAGDPSINHIVIVEQSASISQTFSNNTNTENHVVSGLSGTDRIYYLLYASLSGNYVTNTETQLIMDEFLSLIGTGLSQNIVINNDTIVPSDSSIVNVTLSSLGLNSGTYTSQVIINSNDPLSSLDTIPVSYTVVGSPELALSDTCLDFGSIMENTIAYDSLTIFNNGCDTLFVTNITSAIGEYTSDTTNLLVLPGDSGSVYVTFSPTSTGVFNSILNIFNNDIDTTICLNGVATPAPIISYNPTSITATASTCNDSITIPLTIYNTGGNDLDFEINGSGSNGGTIELLALTYGVDLITEYPNTISAINQSFTNYNLTPINTTSAATLQAALVGKDVFLVPEQENGLASVFTGFATVLQNFVSNGGSVVFCGSQGDFIFNTGLFSGNYISFASSGNLNMLAPSHPLASSIVTPIIAPNATYTYNITNADAFHVADLSGNNVVSYREVGLGKVILVGFDYFATNINSSLFIANAIEWAGTGSLPSWINLSQLTDTIVPADSTIINVTLSTSGLTTGTYNTDIIISSNDPSSPLDTIPVSFTINNAPCVDFTFNIPNSCSGQVDFTEVTLNSPTSWLWNFGDATTSTLQNPTHIYSSSGSYVVQLTVCNASGCNTIDYIVNVTASSGGPIAASCVPGTTNASTFGSGIYNVTFAAINNTSNGGTDGYRDYTCSDSTSVIEGNTYAINVITGAGFTEDVRVWIDLDNDGQFNMTNELVFISDNILQNHFGNVVIPSGGVLNTALRMRVASDRSILNFTSSCSNVTYGQYEDYTILIQSNTIPPHSIYSINILDQCQGVVQFTDMSTNFPTSWSWDFGDATTSTLQNPFHTYSSAGIYNVTLIATNAFGSDDTTQTIVINSLNAAINVLSPLVINQPINFSSTSPGGISWQWDFGNSNQSTSQFPSQTYTSPGIYVVTLTVTNGFGCSSTVTDTLNITTVGIDEHDVFFTIFPNPNDGTMNIVNKSNRNVKEISVVNALGKEVYQFTNNENYFSSQSIEIREVSMGIYFVKVLYEDSKIITRKFLIRNN